MPTLDPTAAAAVAGPIFAPAEFIWIDVVGDPIRVTTFGQDVTFGGTGDPDLDGKTFTSFDHRLIQVGAVTNSENGSDTLTIALSGIVSIDDALMAEIRDTTKWRGRTVRRWTQFYDETGAIAQGAIVAQYTGYASSVKIMPSPDSQTIQLSVENYLAAFNQASNRNYLNQADYDPTDTSASATLAGANMGRFDGGGQHLPSSPWFDLGYAIYNCVTCGTPILMADGSEKPAGELRCGDMVRTRPELADGTLGDWDDYRVVAVRIARDEPVFAAAIDFNPLRGTRDHRVWLNGEWVTLGALGTPDGRADVVRITVADAHTYVSNGVISHNVKQAAS
jgi:hypothetical protein